MPTELTTDIRAVPPAARRVWQLLVASWEKEGIVQPFVDMLREEMDTDDLLAVAKALYGAAADALYETRPKTPGISEYSATRDSIRTARWERAKKVLLATRLDRTTDDWFAWCEVGEVALAICRAIETACEVPA